MARRMVRGNYSVHFYCLLGSSYHVSVAGIEYTVVHVIDLYVSSNFVDIKDN